MSPGSESLASTDEVGGLHLVGIYVSDERCLDSLSMGRWLSNIDYQLIASPLVPLCGIKVEPSNGLDIGLASFSR